MSLTNKLLRLLITKPISDEIATVNQPFNRKIFLESMRGLCALIVVFWHCTLGFFPETLGFFDGTATENSLNTKYIYGFLNGTFSVAFFFILSGFVLTRQFFVTRDPIFIIRNIIKRWPRLAAPVTVVTLLSCALFFAGLYSYEIVGQTTHSPWLERFGYAYETPFKPSFFDAFLQGMLTTFVAKKSYYDSSLWTMFYEFWGSFIAFGLALFLGMRQSKRFRKFIFPGLLLILLLLKCYWYMAFVIGVWLAKTLKHNHTNIKLAPSLLLIAFAFYLAGYSGKDVGIFHPIYLLHHLLRPECVWIIGATILMMTICHSSALQKILEYRAFAFLGWISFPLYLIHVPVLCSLGCAVYLMAQSTEIMAPAMAAYGATIIGAILAAIPLACFNDWAVANLNKATAWILAHEKTIALRNFRLANDTELS